MITLTLLDKTICNILEDDMAFSWVNNSYFCVSIEWDIIFIIFSLVKPSDEHTSIQSVWIFVKFYGTSTLVGYLCLTKWVEYSSMTWDPRSIPSRHTKDWKMVLDTSLLNPLHYKLCIKGKEKRFRERGIALPDTYVY